MSKKHSKSLPGLESLIGLSSGDSGIDSDISSSTKLTNSFEDIEIELEKSPISFLRGAHASQKERIQGVNNAFKWLQEELKKMQLQDKQLTKLFISLRSQIAQETLELEQDNEYDCDSGETNEKEITKETWKLITAEQSFPVDGRRFEDNKRATWAI